MRTSHPWELLPDLAEDRLRLIARLMAHVRDQAASAFNTQAGDDSWSLGCVCYARTKNQITQLAVTTPWLEIVDPSLEFVFKIGAIPIRFHRERDQCRRTTIGIQPRSASLQQNFGFVDPAQSHFRMVVVVGDDHRTSRVELIRYAGLRVTEDSWILFRREVPTRIHLLEAPPAELPAPTVRVRKTGEKGENAS